MHEQGAQSTVLSRRLVLAAGASTFALAGCLDRLPVGGGDGDGGLTSDLPDDLDRAVGALPARVGENGLSNITAGSPDGEGDGSAPAFATVVPDVGVPTDSIDRVVSATYDMGRAGQITAVVGSFDGQDVTADGVLARDGLAVVADVAGDRWEAGRSAAQSAMEGERPTALAAYDLGALFGPVADAPAVFGQPTSEQTVLRSVPSGFDASTVTGLAGGVERDLQAREQESTFVVRFASEGAVDTDGLLDAFEESADRPIDATAAEVDGQRVLVRTSGRLPEDVPDNSPDLYFDIRASGDAGGVLLTAGGSGSASGERLELRIDGEPTSPPWEADATIAAGDEFRIQAPPYAIVGVHWLDPEHEGAAPEIGRSALQRPALLERQYDAGANRLELSLRDDVDRSPDEFAIRVIEPDGRFRETTPLSSFADELTAGTTFTLEDVQYGSRVHVQRRLPDRQWADRELVQRLQLRPSAAFTLETDDVQVRLASVGQAGVPAEDLQVLIDGEPAAVQWSDEYATVEFGDELAIDASVDDRIAIQFVGDELPVTVFEHDPT